VRIRTKTDLKTPVLTPPSDKAHAELGLLYQPCVNPIVLPSVTREHHLNVFDVLDLLQGIAAYVQHTLS